MSRQGNIRLKIMRKLFLLTFAILMFVNFCDAQKVVQIGKLNMISSKNVGDLEDYELVAAYARGNQRKITKSKATTLEEALEQTVREIPGGVFVMNAKVYMIKGKYFAIEGDVWGLKQNANYKGFKVGDHVMWKTVSGYKKGTVEAIKDSEECVVIEDGSLNRTTIKFVKLMRANGADQED